MQDFEKRSIDPRIIEGIDTIFAGVQEQIKHLLEEGNRPLSQHERFRMMGIMNETRDVLCDVFTIKYWEVPGMEHDNKE